MQIVKESPVCKRSGKMSSAVTRSPILDLQDATKWTRAISLEQLTPRRRERLPTEPGFGSIVAVRTSNWDTSSSMSSFAEFGGGSSLTSSPIRSPFVNTYTGVEESRKRDRLATESGNGSGTCFSNTSASDSTASMSSFAEFSGSSLSSSPAKSPFSNTQVEVDELDPAHRGSTLQVPRSPRTPTVARSMGHMISHRFSKMFTVATCDYCFKQMIYGVKCKECRFKCHRDCEPKVPPSCGLPREFIDIFVKSLQEGDPPLPNRTSPLTSGRVRKVTRPPQNIPIQQFPVSLADIAKKGQDSSSNTSSCNSSTRSSPALFAANPAVSTVASPLSATIQTHLFSFDVTATALNGFSLDSTSTTDSVVCDISSTQASNDSDRTVSQTSGSTDSEKTVALRVDSQDSQISDVDIDGPDRSSPRQNSLSNREWEIPFDELKLGEVIGVGHFGTVYRGNWHGDVAIKVLDQKYMDNGNILDNFKQEVAIFRKTRHENLVLFMGACMKAPRLAIVTSLCKGLSLFSHLHLRRDKFNMNKTVLIAQQISQGMGYLHARGIVHKDLKSKNVFLESGKVVITDFGLFSVTKLCHSGGKSNSLSIPPGWLCYLAPELILRLTPTQQLENDLPFSKSSDIYAFGTVWYELLCGEWPYKELPPEAIIWQVGCGIRQPLPTVFSRDVKEIMMMCWSSKADDRPDFGRLVKSLDKIPKKRLARSPSHPVHFSRSTFEF